MGNPNFANRGRTLEELINYSNEQYKAKDLAIVQKVPTPWTVIRKGKQIVSAFPAEKSTVDYIGVTKGKAIAFDAKQCQNKTSFPLRNIEPHQIQFLMRWSRQGGDTFFLIEMAAINKIFKVTFESVLVMLDENKKSIPIKEFWRFREVKSAGGIALDYLGLYSQGGERFENQCQTDEHG